MAFKPSKQCYKTMSKGRSCIQILVI
jgi:hypothetical protein